MQWYETFKLTFKGECACCEVADRNIETIENYLSNDQALSEAFVKRLNNRQFAIYRLPKGFPLSRLPKPIRIGYDFVCWGENEPGYQRCLEYVREPYIGIVPIWKNRIILKAKDIELSLAEVEGITEKTLIPKTEAKIVSLSNQVKLNLYEIEVGEFDYMPQVGSYDLVLKIKDTDISYTVQVFIYD